MKNYLLFLFIFSSFTFAQKRTSWDEVDRLKINPSEKTRRPILPTEYKLYQFDYNSFIQKLVNVPQRDTFTGVSNCIVSVPHPNGELVEYRIVEASTFEPSLQSKFPEIRSFAGQGVKNAGDIIRFSISPSNGLSAIIRSVNSQETYIIDPFSMDYKTFIVFEKSKSNKQSGFICSTEDAVKEFGPTIEKSGNSILNNADDGNLRRFRMAQSCTAEYSNYFGATSAAQVNLVLAGFNATYTRCNAVFEMDFNCTMQLIATTTNVIYYDPITDPYSDAAAGSGGAWNAELGAALQSVIGNANYDIGHLFGASGGGGNAGCIGCVCSADNSKGTGFTSPGNSIPEGDFFDIDYVAHEVGHQLGGNHTFSHSAENNAVNMEPGSGVTIMGYAGITGATDVAAHSIPIFHAGTIQQITNNIKAKSCPVIIVTGNAVPVPSAPATKTLPIGTAFKLTGTATDANAGDILSYCWEQFNDATTVGAAASYPSGTKTNGANFRSFMPENSGTRYFPRLVDHLANGVAGNQWEIVPTINRTLNFRMTVRDNRSGGGNNESVNTAVTFDATKGPFTVTSQNTAGINYTQGSTQTVTWTVNATNTMTGAANVNIKLSTDGGLTYTTTLLANTPNDGTQTVTIPNVFAPYCRILIEPTANDFYAINTTDFAIGYSVSQVCNSYSATPASGTIPQGSYAGWSINVPDSFTISDANITTAITHVRRNQVYAFVRSPQSVDVDLFQGGACGNAIANLNGLFDDESANAPACGVTNNFGNMRPLVSLSGFDGLNSAGTWIFAAADAVTDARAGNVDSFIVNLCYNQIVETPVACGTITSTWNGSAWSNGVPVRNVAAIFAGNYTSTADLEACSVTVNTGANVTFAAGHTLIVGGSVTVNGTGTLTINNNAALRQIDGNAVNTGNIIVRRNSASMVRLDYTAWSSPVSGQQLLAFSPSTIATRFYEYLYTGTTTPTAYQSVSATTNFLKGKGYMIRAANDWPLTATVFSGQFTGVPFNGDTTVSLGRGYNLLGNPYASPMNATKFLDDNPSSVGALYFWTHTVPASGGVYPVNNYASFTKLGGTASAAGGAIPNGTIQTGQGFFVRAFDFGTAKFTNLQRVNASVSTQFYKSSENVATTSESEKHRIWLNLNDTTNNYNQILVGYVNGATNGIDTAIDGEVLDKENTMLYNVINDTEYVIQGKGLPFADTDEIALGLKATTAGTYSISLENVDGLFTSQNVYVKDNVTNIIHDIKQTPYVFTTEEGVFNNRFKVVFTNALNADSIISDENVVVFNQNDELKITASQEIATVEVFDVLGRNIYSNSNVKDKVLNISSIANRNQALLVKITFKTGNSVTKKVIK